jgi:cation:H+ antiporter
LLDQVLLTLGPWPTVILGLVLLVFGGDALVKGAVNLALRLGIPALVVGLTVVAFGTSAPELLVSVQAALADQAGIAVGNVVGSNIVNILLILGLPLLLTTIHTSKLEVRRSYVMMLVTSVFFALIVFTGPLTWWHGLIFLAGLGYMLWDQYRISMAHRAAAAEEDEVEGADPGMGWGRIVLSIIVGLIALGLGARFLVDGAVEIARAFGVTETVIGLTLVAIGTSMPELVTSIIAAIRKQADVAMGNVIGSNIFNILAILGVTSLIARVPVPEQILTFDNWVMIGVALLLAPFVFLRRDMGRLAGVVFVAVYVGYCIVLVNLGQAPGAPA